jgi:hypothetical protein
MKPRSLSRGSITLSVDELERLIDARVETYTGQLTAAVLAKVVAALSAPAKPSFYTSHVKGARPVGWALRRWQVAIKGIPGAHQRGRFWIVSLEDFERWERARSNAPGPEASVAPAWSPKRALEAAGLRAAGGSR